MLTAVPQIREPKSAARIDRFLALMNDHGASDLHLSVGRPPAFRVGGRLDPIPYRAVSAADFEQLMRPITPPAAWERFVDQHDVDFAYGGAGGLRYRVNLFQQERGAGAVVRMINGAALSLEKLGLPPSVSRICELRSGLVLVTGPTGSGKSTTLAAMIDHVNATRALRILTIEDPIELVHTSKRSLISQREVGTHSTSFASALRAGLREDPNVILIGELRDMESIELALAAASTGVVVFATLHTSSAARAIDRIVSSFPSTRQDGVRGMLAQSLRAVVAQQLLARRGGDRVAAIEVLFGSPAVASAIREGKTHQIGGMIQTGKSAGMVAMDDSLRALVETGQVAPVDAYEMALDKDTFRRWLVERKIPLPKQAGMTMIELMMVVAVIGILASVAVVSYTKNVRKARASEVAQIFSEFKVKEESYHAENGTYLSACASPGAPSDTELDCRETDYWPAEIKGGGEATALGALTSRWSSLRIAPGQGSLYCQYAVVAGPAGFAVSGMEARGQELYAGVTTTAKDWFYMVARCDWDGNRAVDAVYWQRGDLTELGHENDSR